MASMTKAVVFSEELTAWLSGKDVKTLESLSETFRERSFAIIILILMATPALPLPTGGITHVFELICMLLELEMIAGRQTLWLPKRWRKLLLGPRLTGKAIPFLLRRIRWFEHYSRPRLHVLLRNTNFVRLVGLILLLLTLATFMAPPFSGLDTLPALGAVIICLSLLLGDIWIFLLGCVVGLIGVTLVIVLGRAAFSAFKHWIR